MFRRLMSLANLLEASNRLFILSFHQVSFYSISSLPEQQIEDVELYKVDLIWITVPPSTYPQSLCSLFLDECSIFG